MPQLPVFREELTQLDLALLHVPRHLHRSCVRLASPSGDKTSPSSGPRVLGHDILPPPCHCRVALQPSPHIPIVTAQWFVGLRFVSLVRGEPHDRAFLGR